MSLELGTRFKQSDDLYQIPSYWLWNSLIDPQQIRTVSNWAVKNSTTYAEESKINPESRSLRVSVWKSVIILDKSPFDHRLFRWSHANCFYASHSITTLGNKKSYLWLITVHMQHVQQSVSVSKLGKTLWKVWLFKNLRRWRWKNTTNTIRMASIAKLLKFKRATSKLKILESFELRTLVWKTSKESLQKDQRRRGHRDQTK